MSRTLITPTRPDAPRVRPNRFLAAGLAAVVAAGGAAIAFSGDDPVAPATPNAAPAAPIIFGDPPVLKGARGGKTDPAVLWGVHSMDSSQEEHERSSRPRLGDEPGGHTITVRPRGQPVGLPCGGEGGG